MGNIHLLHSQEPLTRWTGRGRGSTPQKLASSLARYLQPGTLIHRIFFAITYIPLLLLQRIQKCSSFQIHSNPAKDNSSYQCGYLSTCLRVCSPILDVGHFLVCWSFTQSVGPHWTGDQPVARPLPYIHRTAQTQNKRTQLCLKSIRTYDPSVRAGEDSSCLRPSDHCGRHNSAATRRK
jgi:hypothetical protein